jgi:hypothetical protein
MVYSRVPRVEGMVVVVVVMGWDGMRRGGTGLKL